MADGAAYTTVPGKIAPLLAKIREVGVPDKATREWLKTLGMKSSNDPSLLPVLRQIDFIAADGKPTQRWRDYRGAKHKAVLGEAIRHGYASLFQTYADAPTRSNTDLAHVFSAQTSSGKQSVDKMVSTFKNLASQAEFDGPTMVAQGTTPQPTTPATTSAAPARVPVETKSSGSVTLNVNIQLTLPETTDSKVFDAFFKSMKKHLLTEDES